MNRSVHAFPKALVLFLALAITTGWAEPSPATSRAGDDLALDTLAAASVRWTGHEARQDAAWSAIRPVVYPLGLPDEPLPGPGVRMSDFVVPAVVKPAPVEPPKAEPKPAPKPAAAPAPTIVRNHFWIPKLGMSYHVHLFECTRKRPPDNYIYRWGCAGTNNVYILGHAYGVMKPLHDLYVRGGLRVGLVARYADRRGVVHTYRVTEWRVVDPVDSHWAIASQPVPSMTLQTCVGKDGRYRLNVRLVEV
jgi:hypothetical protein